MVRVPRRKVKTPRRIIRVPRRMVSILQGIHCIMRKGVRVPLGKVVIL
jgi:hypothetical protein